MKYMGLFLLLLRSYSLFFLDKGICWTWYNFIDYDILPLKHVEARKR